MRKTHTRQPSDTASRHSAQSKGRRSQKTHGGDNALQNYIEALSTAAKTYNVPQTPQRPSTGKHMRVKSMTGTGTISATPSRFLDRLRQSEAGICDETPNALSARKKAKVKADVGLRVMGNIKNDSELIFSPGATGNSTRWKTINQETQSHANFRGTGEKRHVKSIYD